MMENSIWRSWIISHIILLLWFHLSWRSLSSQEYSWLINRLTRAITLLLKRLSVYKTGVEIFLVKSGHFAQSPLGKRGETNLEVHVHRTESWGQIEWCAHLYNPFSNHASCFPTVEPLVQPYFSDYMHKITPSGVISVNYSPEHWPAHLNVYVPTPLLTPVFNPQTKWAWPLLGDKGSGTEKYSKSACSRSFLFGLFMKNCKNRYKLLRSHLLPNCAIKFNTNYGQIMCEI